MPVCPPRSLAATAVCVALSLAPRPGLAEPEAPVALEVVERGAGGCPGAEPLASAINAVLSRQAVVVAPPVVPHATIHIELTSTPNSARATLSLVGPDGAKLGSRSIARPGRCSSLEGPAAIVAALLVDVARTNVALSLPPARAVPAPASVEPSEAAARHQAGPTSPPAPVLAAAPPAPIRARGELASAAMVGLLPGVALGARGEVRVSPTPPPARGEGDRAGAWGLIRGDVFPSSSTSGGGPGGVFSAWAVGAGACWLALGRPSASVEGCLAGSLGALQASGTGAREVREVASFLALASADLSLRVKLFGPLGARAGAGLSAGHRPSSFSFDRPGEPLVVHRPWPVAVIGTLGLSIGE